MGAFGIFMTIFFATLIQATPLLFTALGGMVNERSGVVNIGLEGVMTFGAFAGATTITLMEISGLSLPGYVLIAIGLIVTIIVGILVGLFYALLTITMRIDQTIIGVALNMAALGITLYLAEILFGRPQTSNILASRTTFFGGELYLITIIAIIMAFILLIVFKYSVWGKHVDAVGENPQAADAMGLNVIKIRYQAVVVSSILGAIGGMSIVLTTTGNFTGATVSGLGFIALAVMLFGKRNPYGILFASLAFGLFRSASTVVSVIFTNLPFDDVYLKILPYVLTIIALIIFSRSSSDPKALGTAYEKEVR